MAEEPPRPSSAAASESTTASTPNSASSSAASSPSPSAASMRSAGLAAYCFGNFAKHATLVKKVYPQDPTTQGPSSSELSYLVFYAKHRPEKLVKVSSYLYRKYLRDKHKHRTANHAITLAIFNALITECPEYVTYLAIDLIHILVDMTDDGNVELLPNVTTTFSKFCGCYPGTLDRDPVFWPAFQTLVERFCGYAVPKATANGNAPSDASVGQDAVLQNGLSGVQAVALSQFVFASAKCEKYIEKIVPALLSNVRVLALPSPPQTPVDATAAATVPVPVATSNGRTGAAKSPNSTAELALSTLKHLVSTASTSMIAHVVLPIVAYMDQKSMWSDTSWATLVLQAVTDSTSTPTHAILVSQVLLRLNSPSFGHKPKLLMALPNLHLGEACLVISLQDLADCLIRCACEHAAHVETALVWLTHKLVGADVHDFLMVIMARVQSVAYLRAIMGTLEKELGEPTAHQANGAVPPEKIAIKTSQPMVRVPVTLDALAPLGVLLDRPEADLREQALGVLTRAVPSPLASLDFVFVRSPRSPTGSDGSGAAARGSRLEQVPRPAAVAFLTRHATTRKHWSQCAENLLPPLLRAMLAHWRDNGVVPELAEHVPRVDGEADLDSEAALAGVDMAVVRAVLAGRPVAVTSAAGARGDSVVAGAGADFPTPAGAAQTDVLTPSGLSPPGGRPRLGSVTTDVSDTQSSASGAAGRAKVLRFDARTHATIIEDARSILEGKQVSVRPLSMGPDWALPRPSEVDAALDDL